VLARGGSVAFLSTYDRSVRAGDHLITRYNDDNSSVTRMAEVTSGSFSENVRFAQAMRRRLCLHF
jgi:hypothetical protein